MVSAGAAHGHPRCGSAPTRHPAPRLLLTTSVKPAHPQTVFPTHRYSAPGLVRYGRARRSALADAGSVRPDCWSVRRRAGIGCTCRSAMPTPSSRWPRCPRSHRSSPGRPAADAQVTPAPGVRRPGPSRGRGIGPEARVVWPQATTYFEPRPGLERVVLGRNSIGTPRNRDIALASGRAAKEGRYLGALPSRRRAPATVSTRGE